MMITRDDEFEQKAALEEYRALKAEVLANQVAARKITTLALAFVGALVALVRASDDRNMISKVLLYAPAVFVMLMMLHLRYSFLALRMGEYIRLNIAQRIQKRLPDRPGLMAWEDMSADGLTVIGIFIKGAAFAIPLATAVSCLIAVRTQAPALVLWVYGGAIIYCILFAAVAIWSRDRRRATGARGSCRGYVHKVLGWLLKVLYRPLEESYRSNWHEQQIGGENPNPGPERREPDNEETRA
jgi:hypothetical protein